MKRKFLKSLSLFLLVSNFYSTTAFCRTKPDIKDEKTILNGKVASLQKEVASFEELSEIEKKREKIIEYMEAMRHVEWSPKEDILYWNPKMGFVYKKGETYYGIPYTQKNRDATLEKFLMSLEDVNGKKVYNGPYKKCEYLGTDCSKAIITAWTLNADPGFMLDDTLDMFKNLGKGSLEPVGEYFYTGDEHSTLDIADKNGEEVIFKSYENLQPGDAILTCSYETYYGNDWRNNYWHCGHVRLVVKVDVDKQTIEYIDQAGVDNEKKLYGANGKSSWRRETISFKDAYKKGCIAVGLAKLLNKPKN